MKNFENPELKVVKFENEDVITTSGGEQETTTTPGGVWGEGPDMPWG